MDTGTPPKETFYDGYVVNSVIDACYKAARTKKWEPVEIQEWRGGKVNAEAAALKDFDAEHFLIKEEKMPDGKVNVILKDRKTGEITQTVR
jgi:hypothetical protein